MVGWLGVGGGGGGRGEGGKANKKQCSYNIEINSKIII